MRTCEGSKRPFDPFKPIQVVLSMSSLTHRLFLIVL